MTFSQKMRTHVGDLVKVNLADFRSQNFLNGKIGVVCGAAVGGQVGVMAALFIDGKIHHVLLYQEEVQFLERL